MSFVASTCDSNPAPICNASLGTNLIIGGGFQNSGSISTQQPWGLTCNGGCSEMGVNLYSPRHNSLDGIGMWIWNTSVPIGYTLWQTVTVCANPQYILGFWIVNLQPGPSYDLSICFGEDCGPVGAASNPRNIYNPAFVYFSRQYQGPSQRRPQLRASPLPARPTAAPLGPTTSVTAIWFAATPTGP
ncbi:hypothetical protein BDZ45DRAFT_374876 [Acephala macrosclerotiorum]|nr:hypothetical protein BDZ45DRAFT_374876 [Acephala macrosclerotiorum]